MNTTTSTNNNSSTENQDIKKNGAKNLSTITFVPLVGNDSITFGQKLIVLKFDNLLRECEGNISAEQVKILKDSLKTRLAYEAALDEIAKIELEQEGRLRVEKLSSKRINRDFSSLSSSTTQLGANLDKKIVDKNNEVDGSIKLEKNSLSQVPLLFLFIVFLMNNHNHKNLAPNYNHHRLLLKKVMIFGQK